MGANSIKQILAHHWPATQILNHFEREFTLFLELIGYCFRRVKFMKKKHSGPQIVAKLRQADVLIGQGKSIPEVCREIEVSDQTYYRWRQKYGGMSPEMIKQLRELQKENARLKRVVADQALDNAILKEASAGNY
jgi:transposase-like protein